MLKVTAKRRPPDTPLVSSVHERLEHPAAPLPTIVLYGAGLPLCLTQANTVAS